MAAVAPSYYHVTAMTPEENKPNVLPPSADAVVEQTASHLRGALADLAARLRPFPAFLNMVSLQAVELDPVPGAPADQGCVVVLSGGEICELDLKMLPGIEGIRDIDSVEELRELDLSPGDYIIYAAAAIRLLHLELRRRGQ